MRKEEFYIDSFVHVYNCGTKKLPIVRDEKDRKHFLQAIYYLNDENSHDHLFRQLYRMRGNNFRDVFKWPDDWSERKPIVKIIAFILMNNHFHLVLQEIKEGGIARFMQKVGNSLSGHFNTKYNEIGSIFHGSYKARHIDQDGYLEYLAVYVMVKNAFELYPGGLKKAVENFDDAYDFAVNYLYSSLAVYAGKESLASEIIDINGSWLKEDFANPKSFKEFARDCILNMDLDNKIADLALE